MSNGNRHVGDQQEECLKTGQYVTDSTEMKMEDNVENGTENKTLEKTFADLDQVIAALEDTDTGLEASFRLYQTGMELVKECSKKIELVESKVLMVNEDGGFDEL